MHFNPKDIALHGLTAMVKVMAQMKNLRRAHTSQGHVKKIEIDQTYEGYANFMAPGRMQMIASDARLASTRLDHLRHCDNINSLPKNRTDEEVQEAQEKFLKQEKFLEQQKKDAAKVFSPDILKPKADTYLTAEWDEMIPFPTSKLPPAPLKPQKSTFSSPNPTLPIVLKYKITHLLTLSLRPTSLESPLRRLRRQRLWWRKSSPPPHIFSTRRLPTFLSGPRAKPLWRHVRGQRAQGDAGGPGAYETEGVRCAGAEPAFSFEGTQCHTALRFSVGFSIGDNSLNFSCIACIVWICSYISKAA